MSLPFVYLGWAKDFWDPFEWYLQVERNLPATYYLIPFKGRPGDRVAASGAARRATAYDVSDPDLKPWIDTLVASGCEVGVHGIDAWHSAQRGIAERSAVAAAAGGPVVGIRMHWLLRDRNTPAVLESAGYATVEAAIAGYPGDFTLADLERSCPGVSRDMVRRVLRDQPRRACRVVQQHNVEPVPGEDRQALVWSGLALPAKRRTCRQASKTTLDTDRN